MARTINAATAEHTSHSRSRQVELGEVEGFRGTLIVLRGKQDVRRADPFASFIQRRGYKTSKVHSLANRNNTGKTKSPKTAHISAIKIVQFSM